MSLVVSSELALENRVDACEVRGHTCTQSAKQASKKGVYVKKSS
jgi:hypothetical protein